MMRAKEWFKKHQEFAGMVPLLVILSIAAWVIFGALDRRLGTDALGLLLELPILSAYALAALGLTRLALRRQRRELGKGERADLWLRTLNGERGPLIVYVVDTLAWALCICIAFSFFWPSR